MTMRVRKAIFPVGGLGTRFLPATKAMPKEMLPVVDKPLIQYAVEEAQAAGIEEFIFVTGRGKSAIEDHFDHSFELAAHARRARQERGARRPSSDLAAEARRASPTRASRSRSASAMRCGARATWSATSRSPSCWPTTWCMAATPCLKQMVEAYNEVGGNLVAVMDVPREQTNRYGILKTGERRRPPGRGRRAWSRSRSPTRRPRRCPIIGRYILQPERVRASRTGRARRRRRDPAHRRDGAPDRAQPVPRPTASRASASTAATRSASSRPTSPSPWRVQDLGGRGARASWRTASEAFAAGDLGRTEEAEDIDAHRDDRHRLCRPGLRRLLFRVRRRRRLRRQG